MSFEEFEHQARLYVVGALDPAEMPAFDAGRLEYGAKAEACIFQSRRMSAAIALTLHPHPPQQDAKEKLLTLIRENLHRKSAKP